MRLGFLSLPTDERRLYLDQAAIRRNVSAVVLEKDFWVCWVLRELFAHKKLSAHLIFKGGTSLSKVFKVVHRFSEDIDLAVDWEMLGFTGPKERRLGCPQQGGRATALPRPAREASERFRFFSS